jgi:hypothetical protein
MDDGQRNDDVRFEPTDVYVGPIVGFTAVLAMIIAACMLVLWMVQANTLDREESSKRPINQMAAERGLLPETQRRPPEPRIEGIGLADATYSVVNRDNPKSAVSRRMAEERQLADGWTDAGHRRHPPIEQAMREIAKKYQRSNGGAP